MALLLALLPFVFLPVGLLLMRGASPGAPSRLGTAFVAVGEWFALLWGLFALFMLVITLDSAMRSIRTFGDHLAGLMLVVAYGGAFLLAFLARRARAASGLGVVLAFLLAGVAAIAFNALTSRG